jgi:hypothetical protein
MLRAKLQRTHLGNAYIQCWNTLSHSYKEQERQGQLYQTEGYHYVTNFVYF